MLKKIEEIRRSLEHKLYLTALSLALTIPDICGQIEYPEYVNKKGNRLVGMQYKLWFDEWVNHYYADPTGWTEDYSKAKNPYFTGQMCYDLRCSYLHSGNVDIQKFGEKEDKENLYSYHFELCTNGCNSIGTRWETPQRKSGKIKKLRSVRIEVGELCEYLCISAEKYYEYKGKKAFFDNQVKIVDIQEELKK
ncbi:hypothetical protein ACO1PF_04750 [Alkalibacterium sp. f15]|uniref:hypothetical protein n=1 Tax=Alkalibacterium sp. f15 TaxID=3414029 RepID=UPI003BF794F0